MILKTVNLVISMKVDRLKREGYDGQWFLRFCKEHDCGLIFLQENYDVNTPEGEMGYGISLLFGQRERRLISQRTKTCKIYIFVLLCIWMKETS